MTRGGTARRGGPSRRSCGAGRRVAPGGNRSGTIPAPILAGMADQPTVAPELVLAGEFPPAGRDRWLGAVASALDRKGGLTPDAALDRLRTTTYDGITIEPLYTAADAPRDAAPAARVVPTARTGRRVGRPPARRRRRRTGTSRRRARARGDVDPPRRHRAGDTIDVDTLAGVLDGVLLDLAPVAVARRARWPEAAEALLALYDRAGVDAGGGTLGADPIGSAAVDGPSASLDEQLDAVAAWCTRLGADHPGLRVVTVDGARFHDAGASDGQELGCHDRRRRRVPAAPRERAASTSRTPSGGSSCASPRPATSSPRSPSSAPSGCCGRASPTLSARPAPPAHACPRRHVDGDDDDLRPVGERLALDRRLLRRRRRRRRRRHRVPARPPPRRRGHRARPAHRPQHAVDPDRGVAPRRGQRSGRRVVVRGALHRRAGRGRVGVVPGARGGRRVAWRPPPEDSSPSASPRPRGPPPRHRHPTGAAHRADRVPEHRRTARRPCRRQPAGRRTAGRPDFEALRGRVDARGRGDGQRPAVFLATIGTPADVHAASHVRQELLRGRRRWPPSRARSATIRTPSPRRSHARTPPSPASAPATPPTPTTLRPSPARSSGRRHGRVRSPAEGRTADLAPASTERSMSASTSAATLTDLLDLLEVP